MSVGLAGWSASSTNKTLWDLVFTLAILSGRNLLVVFKVVIFTQKAVVWFGSQWTSLKIYPKKDRTVRLYTVNLLRILISWRNLINEFICGCLLSFFLQEYWFLHWAAVIAIIWCLIICVLEILLFETVSVSRHSRQKKKNLPVKSELTCLECHLEKFVVALCWRRLLKCLKSYLETSPRLWHIPTLNTHTHTLKQTHW